ncbi:hypothetical protein AgCh_039680 [Apium graveolens]
MSARLESSPDFAKKMDRVRRAAMISNILLLRTFKEIEGKYIDYISVLSQKKSIPVGPLVQEEMENTDDSKETVQFLEKKDESSVVFVSFGSKYFLSKDEIHEVGYGLELSKLNFIWVVRFPFGENIKLEEALPLGFLDSVGDRGLVMEGWAPQARILRHSSTGGFVSHWGWGSIMESMMFGVPVIAMPMHLDQPYNAVAVIRSRERREWEVQERRDCKSDKKCGIREKW